MATLTDPDQDELSRARNTGDEDYRRKIPSHFEKKKDSPDPSAPDTREFGLPSDDAPPDENELRDQEEKPTDTAGRSDEDIGTQESRGFRYTGGEARSTGRSSPVQGLRNRRNAIVVTLAIMGGTVGIFGLITAPAFLLVQLKEAMVQKFGDRMSSLQQVRVNRIVVKQLLGDPLTTGCSTVKVKCRYKGMSDKQLDKFKERNKGAIIRADDEKNAFGRHKVKSITFIDNGRPRTVTPTNFKRFVKNSPEFRKLILNYNKSKVAVWRDKTAGKVLTKLKLYAGKVRAKRGPPQTEEERRTKIETARKEKKARQAAVADKHRGAIKKVNLISTLCAIKGLISLAKDATKIKLAAEMAVFAFQFMNAADTIKAGEATGDSGTTNNISNLGDTLTQQDENGKTFADSYGYQYASQGVLIKDKGNQEDYQMSVASNKGLMGSIDRASSGVPGLGAVSGAVSHVLNPTVCTVAGVLDIGFCIASGLTYCFTSVATVNLLTNLAMPLILKQLFKTPDVKNAVGGDAGDATTGGFSYVSKTNNQYRGGYPLSKSQAIKYDTFSDNAQAGGNYENVSSQMDPYDSGSLAGKLAAAFLPSAARVSASASNIPTTLANLPTTGLSRLTSDAQARSVIKDEYNQCKDGDYENLDVAADPYCVPQYGLDPSLVLGDSDFNKPVAALGTGHKGFSLASFFETPVARAAGNDTRGFTPDNRFDADAVIAYMHDGAKPWIDDDGESIDYSDQEDDYHDYVTECQETTDPLEPDSPDMCKTKNCKAGSGTNEFRYCMFSVYTSDTSIDDQLEDKDATSSGETDEEPTDEEGNSSTGPSGAFTGSGKEAAKALIDSGNVTIGDDKELIQKMADGKDSPLDESLIKVLAGLAKNHKYSISSLYRGPCSGSHHCEGKAVDINPTINGKTISYNGHSEQIQSFVDDAARLLETDCENGVPNQEYVQKTKSGGSKCQVFVDKGTGPHVHLAVGG